MITLQMERSSVEMLVRYLESDLSDLSVEIAGTDKKSYRDEIKGERTVLRNALEELRRGLKA